jgi:hypothetical protein
MTDNSERQEVQDGAFSSLNMAIYAVNLAKEASRVIPTTTAFASTSVLLATIRVGFPPVHFGRLPANVYRTQ